MFFDKSDLEKLALFRQGGSLLYPLQAALNPDLTPVLDDTDNEDTYFLNGSDQFIDYTPNYDT